MSIKRKYAKENPALNGISEIETIYTVNVVIFAGGKCRKMLTRHFMWGLFSGSYSYFLHKGIWVLFSCWGNFHKETKRQKLEKRKTFKNFHVNSIWSKEHQTTSLR